MTAPAHHEFALALERVMREAGLGTGELAARAGVAERTLRRYRAGERRPDPLTVARLEAACHVPAGRLARVEETRPADDGPVTTVADPAPPSPRLPRRRAGVAVAGTLLAALLVAGAILAVSAGGGDEPVRPPNPVERTVAAGERITTTSPQRAGGPARAWSDYRMAGGRLGPQVRAEQVVRVRCRVRGFVVQSGNPWWYLLAQPPWNGRYFSSADAFYNVRDTRGVDFTETRFVDPSVPLCR